MMKLSDDWPILAPLGLLFLAFGFLVYIAVNTGHDRAKYATACHAAGGTPVMSDKGNYCVEKFADMRGENND